MTIQSKFKSGDTVWFIKDINNIQCLEGQVVDVLYWEKETGFVYEILHSGESFTGPETSMFSSKEELMTKMFENE